jgi:hypothetical protein
MSPNRMARLAGLFYLLNIVFGIFAHKVVRESVLIIGDAALTVSNVLASESLFRMAFASDLVMILSYLLLAATLYTLFKDVSKNQASLMMLFVLIATPILAVNLINHANVLSLLGGADYLNAFTSAQIGANVMLSFEAFHSGVIIAQIFFGAWLLPLGYLVYKSGYFPKVLGGLLVIGGIGMMGDTFLNILYPSYEGILKSVIEVLGLSELVFCAWLLVKGANVNPSTES